MSEYSEWLEAAVGMGALDEATDQDTLQQATVYQQRRDAVLCLIDCQLSMFQGGIRSSDPGEISRIGADNTPGEDSTPAMLNSVATSGCSKGRNTTMRKQSTDVFFWPDVGGEGAERRIPAGMATGDEKVTDPEVTGNRINNTPFRDAVRCVLKLCQDKVLMSDKDLVALALYNTNKRHNIYELPGLYIVHPFSLLSVQSVRELEGLAASGDVSSMMYEEFKKNIGHAQRNEVHLSDVLWAAQHMFLSLHSNLIKYRRVFIFTNDDEPHKGETSEKERCLARVRELYEAGVTIEVFAIGKSPNTGAGEMGMGRGEANFDALNRATRVADTQLQGGVKQREDTVRFTDCVDAERHFKHEGFWDQLDRGERFAQGMIEHERLGAVHVTGGVEVFDHLLNAVRRRTHPQRPFQNYALTIGISVGGSPVPTMAVSVYHPLLPATLPRAEWLDHRTNAIVPRRAQLVVKRPLSSFDSHRLNEQETTNDATKAEDSRVIGTPRPNKEVEEETLETVVNPDHLLYSTIVGGRRLFFSAQERQHIFLTATAGAPVGFSILCFKHKEDILQHKHVICKSSFLRPNPYDGGEASLRLFVQLTRTLVRGNKVAVAQYVARRGAAPRLVALAPSSPAVPVPTCSLPAKGLGLYVVPLPYSEDIRDVPSLPCFNSATIPSQEDVDLAAGIVSCLSVSYDINAVPNPSLQLRYQALKEMALRQATESGVMMPEKSGNKPGTMADMSLPDSEGMAQYAPIFHDFNAKLLGPSYDAARLCPQPKRSEFAGEKSLRTGSGGHREGDDVVDNAAIHLVETAFEQNALPTLTVMQLKAYLSALGESTAGARRKDEVIEVVKHVLLRQRGERA
ncbi:putative KU70 protein [Trypanosoma cruzi]|uniref:KU70 protein, putative n=2 Tax=Trypanosoma cruzi TaxID=5693 RepID=Q4CY05_TRYCC|nr:KU70 protein, putative [Trypanosoma cruzi]EAN85154.1 KU70 protein, putative [Trypanosoma cruzi]PWV12869.1 putative KU70 protein [Trypanosoma cruzi]RNC53016.1 putative KU70 protein [Trypanosoma cruzi]|eukprot:XP_807005.1 KU70 protein [Trypanosoma cruzi strain CL Brener]